MIAFRDSSGKSLKIENMDFSKSKNGKVTCILFGPDGPLCELVELATGNGYTTSEAFLTALDAIDTAD